MNCNNSTCSNLNEVLSVIIKLQKQGECIDGSSNTCDRPYLGINSNSTYNTRPISFYTCPNNILWTMPYTLNDVEGTSSIFRAEAVEDCCLTCRVLVENGDNTYQATESFFTINLNCISALRCLDDTFIPCI